MGTDKMPMSSSIWYFVGVWGCVTSDILDHSVPANVHRQVMHFSNCVDIKQEMCISCHLSENYMKVLVNQNCKMQ